MGRTVKLLLLAAVAAGCSDRGQPAPTFGIERRVEVPPLRLPTGLPRPLPVQLTDAFPGLLFERPLLLTAPPDGSDRVVVVEQAGRVRIFRNDPGTSTTKVFLDLTSKVLFGGEQGLLGLAFHPDYASNGWCYVYYSIDLPRRTILSRWKVSGDPDVIDPSSEEVLLEIAQPFANHNGGSLAFGADGKLYVACGDGGAGDDPLQNGQSLQSLLGSVLRLNDDGSIPADNPFVRSTQGVRGEIWAYGLRNPWRMSFDRTTGRLWLGDVGQGAAEEINIIERAGNYGWRVFEGNRSHLNPQGLPASSFTAPVLAYGRDAGKSVTGGHVYRGAAVPTLRGAYVYGDFVSGKVWALVYAGGEVISNTQITTTVSPASFGEDAAGELYLCCFDGRIRKLVPDATPPPPAALPAKLSETGLFTDTERLTPAPGVIEYDLRAPFWSEGADKRRWIALPNRTRMTFSSDGSYRFPVGTVLVKHFEWSVAIRRRRLETRVFLKQESGWLGFSYRWNPRETDADLVASGGETFAVDGETWTIPSRADCMTCHNSAAGHVLGVRTGQLNRDFDFPLRRDNQLRVWNHLGLFTTDIGLAAQHPVTVDPRDENADLLARARVYLDIQCGTCHRPQGPTPLDMDLRAATDISAMRVFGVASTNPVVGRAGLRGRSGAPFDSDLLLRMGRGDGMVMPPGSRRADLPGMGLIGDWIQSDPAK